MLYQFITGKVILRRLCVTRFIWTCQVGLLLPVRCLCRYLVLRKPGQKYGSFAAQQSWPELGVWLFVVAAEGSSRFWVVTGIKHDVSYCYIMWQPVWVTSAKGGWKQNWCAGRPCVEEDEDYLITDAKGSESPKSMWKVSNTTKITRKKKFAQKKPNLRMNSGIVLVLRTSDCLRASPAIAACCLLTMIGAFPKKSCWPFAVNCSVQLLEATVPNENIWRPKCS